MPNKSIDLTCEIRNVLAIERHVLLSGEFARLASLSERKSELLDLALGAELLGSVAELKAIQTSASENNRLLKSALEGVKAARTRFDVILQMGDRLDTYDSSGRQHSISMVQGRVEKRS